MKRNLLPVAAAVAMLAGMPATADAIELPCSTVRVIVPAGAGGITDLETRLIADIANRLGAEPPLQAVNIGGQGGVEGGRELRDAEPDGCTLMYAHLNPMLFYLTGRINVNYADYEPIALMTSSWRMLGASSQAPYDDLREMVAYARENGDGSIVAGATLGATSHFQLLLVEQEGDFKFKIVSYSGGRERITALLANNIQVSDIGTTEASQYVEAGQLKALVILGPERSRVLPDVPTSGDLGFESQFSISHGFHAPGGTPDDIIAYYADLFRQVAEDPEFIDRMEALDTDVSYLPPDDYRSYLDNQYATMKELAIAIDIYKPQE
jgi:tripartite-type tricarboxylate transporter receptor subunit TctC